jgi:hypothetical protein
MTNLPCWFGCRTIYSRPNFSQITESGTIQGGAVNRGLKPFFSMLRPSCLIEAYVRPEKYWLVWAGPLADHLNNLYFIFLSDILTAAAERAACFADLDRR